VYVAMLQWHSLVMGDGGRCDLLIQGQLRDRIASQKGIYVGRKVVLLLMKPDDEQINVCSSYSGAVTLLLYNIPTDR